MEDKMTQDDDCLMSSGVAGVIDEMEKMTICSNCGKEIENNTLHYFLKGHKCQIEIIKPQDDIESKGDDRDERESALYAF
jgi:hypothetical protein